MNKKSLRRLLLSLILVSGTTFSGYAQPAWQQTGTLEA